MSYVLQHVYYVKLLFYSQVQHQKNVISLAQLVTLYKEKYIHVCDFKKSP